MTFHDYWLKGEDEAHVHEAMAAAGIGLLPAGERHGDGVAVLVHVRSRLARQPENARCADRRSGCCARASPDPKAAESGESVGLK